LRRFNPCWRCRNEFRKTGYFCRFFRVSRTHRAVLARYWFRETVAPANYRLVNSPYHDYRQRFGKGRSIPRFFHSGAWRIRSTEREATAAPDQS
jgi:hypothetical protein